MINNNGSQQMNRFVFAFLVSLPIVSVHAQTTYDIFGTATPQNPVDPDTNGVTLGVKFTSTTAGKVTGIRWYRGHTNNAGYTAKLFNAGGALLASKKTAGDTCHVPCWEQANFTTPVAITANTVYIAAVYTSNGRYPGDNYGLTTAVVNGPLTALASQPSGPNGPNGVYTYSATGYPANGYENSNYWVDVVLSISAPVLNLSVSPTSPSVPADALPGTVVATIAASWSDGSQFTGSYGFTVPYQSDGTAFALSGTFGPSVNLIVNAPLSGDAGTVQNVTVEATQ
jgi:hypothetical protein